MGWEGPLEKEMATHSSIFAWRIPWTEKPLGLQSMGSQRFGQDWVINITTIMLTIIPINAYILSRSRPDESVGGDNLKEILVRGLPWTPKTVIWWIFDFCVMHKQHEIHHKFGYMQGAGLGKKSGISWVASSVRGEYIQMCISWSVSIHFILYWNDESNPSICPFNH